MIGINNIEKTLRIGLNTINESYLFIKGNTVHKPKDETTGKVLYPYATVQAVSEYQPEGMGAILKQYDKEVNKLKVTRREYPQMTYSITCISNEDEEAKQMAMDTLEYLKFTGQQYLSNNDIIVIEVSNIQDRSIIYEEVAYEYRQGIDVRIRVVSKVSMYVDYAKSIDVINKGE